MGIDSRSHDQAKAIPAYSHSYKYPNEERNRLGLMKHPIEVKGSTSWSLEAVAILTHNATNLQIKEAGD